METGLNCHDEAMRGTAKVLEVGKGTPMSTRQPKSNVEFPLFETPQNKPWTRQIHTQQSTKRNETGLSRQGDAMKGTGKMLRVGLGPPKSTRWPKLKVVFRHRSNRHKTSHESDKFIPNNQPMALQQACIRVAMLWKGQARSSELVKVHQSQPVGQNRH